MGVFDGVLIWIHDVAACEGGNVQAIVSRLQQHNCSGAIIKVTDGTGYYGNWGIILSLVNALKAAGLIALTWGYNYGANPSGEALVAVQAISTFNPDGHGFDTEIEMESLADPAGAANTLLNEVKAVYPNIPLFYSPVSNIQGHLRCPYRQFTDAGCVMFPQTYYLAYQWTPTYTLSSFYASANQYQLETQPIYPAYMDSPGGGYTSTTAQVQEFLSQLPASVTGVSNWVYDLMDASAWNRVDLASAKFPPAGGSLIQKLQAEVAQLQTEISTLLGKIAAAIKDLS